jgi:hypothetical protein
MIGRMEPTAEMLLDRTLELSVPLHEAIRAFDEPNAHYVIAAAPGVALFERDATDTIGHWSSSPVPSVVSAVEDLRARHLAAARVDEGADNSHLPALLLACLFLADESSTVRERLGSRVRRPAAIEPLTEEEGTHDPSLEPHDAALRIWTPLRQVDGEDVHTAILQLVFASERTSRYVPW